MVQSILYEAVQQVHDYQPDSATRPIFSSNPAEAPDVAESPSLSPARSGTSMDDIGYNSHEQNNTQKPQDKE